jgi:hypothetical protein
VFSSFLFPFPVGENAVCLRLSIHVLPARVMEGTEGQDRLRRRAFNCRYLSNGLRQLGFIVHGHQDSPIIPLLIFAPGKMGVFSRMVSSRTRLCHKTKSERDLRFSSRLFPLPFESPFLPLSLPLPSSPSSSLLLLSLLPLSSPLPCRCSSVTRSS